MSKLIRKTAILAKVEVTRGTDPTPTGAANAILVSNVQHTPIEGDVIARDNIRPFFGSGGSVLVTQYSRITFDVEMAGVATAGAEPRWAALFRGCSASVTVDAGTDVTIAPVTDGIESLTIYANVDGVRSRMHDVHGNVRGTVDAKGIPKWSFEFTGSFVPVDDSALPTVDYDGFLAPLGVNKANSTISLDGYSAACSAFTFDAGNTVVKRDLMNVDSVEITNRVSTGSITFENTSVATKNWIAMAQASAQVPLVLRHGQGLTNVVKIEAAHAQVGKPTYSDSDGVQMITIPLEFVPSSAGNDEWSIVVH